MENLIFFGSIIGIPIFIWVMVYFYKWYNNKLPVTIEDYKILRSIDKYLDMNWGYIIIPYKTNAWNSMDKIFSYFDKKHLRRDIVYNNQNSIYVKDSTLLDSKNLKTFNYVDPRFNNNVQIMDIVDIKKIYIVGAYNCGNNRKNIIRYPDDFELLRFIYNNVKGDIKKFTFVLMFSYVDDVDVLNGADEYIDKDRVHECIAHVFDRKIRMSESLHYTRMFNDVERRNKLGV